MLDDLRKIHERDSRDVLGAIASAGQQLSIAFSSTPAFMPREITNVVCSGMGGSAIAPLFLSSLSACTVPFEVVRDYELPRYVSDKTLVIACSYSGNTEETIEAVGRAAEADAQIVVVTSGGKLAALAQEKNYPLVLLRKLEHSRFAEFSIFNALVSILDNAGVCSIKREDLVSKTDFLGGEIASWLPTVPTRDNLAKQIAQECMGKSVVIYASSMFASAAYRWKMTINESAKQVAWWGVLPEFNHNEFAGWSGLPDQKPYVVIELRSDLDHPRLQKRFEITERLLSGLRPAPLIVHMKGRTALEQLLRAVVLGDFVGAYLAILSGINPAPLDIVDKFKDAMGGYTYSPAESI